MEVFDTHARAHTRDTFGYLVLCQSNCVRFCKPVSVSRLPGMVIYISPQNWPAAGWTDRAANWSVSRRSGWRLLVSRSKTALILGFLFFIGT